MKRFGLIGHPIAHSLSPALFKAGYDGKYPYELIETADFDEAYIRFLNGYEGINVTAPFKELAYARADILSDECRIIKATNLLIRTPEGIKAYNSDYLGVRMWLQEVAEGLKRTPPTSWAPPPAARGIARFSSPLPPPASTSVLIIGTGGAGKAAAVAAASLGMDLILMNRSMEKAEAVAESISQMQDAPYAEVRPMEDFRECFRDAALHTMEAGERALLMKLRTMQDVEFEGLPFGSEGLWRKFMHNARRFASLEDILTATKSKRYTRSRLDRMAMCAFLGITEDLLSSPAPYVRVLAFNDKGRSLLRKHKEDSHSAMPVTAWTVRIRRWKTAAEIFMPYSPFPTRNLPAQKAAEEWSTCMNN